LPRAPLVTSSSPTGTIAHCLAAPCGSPSTTKDRSSDASNCPAAVCPVEFPFPFRSSPTSPRVRLLNRGHICVRSGMPHECSRRSRSCIGHMRTAGVAAVLVEPVVVVVVFESGMSQESMHCLRSERHPSKQLSSVAEQRALHWSKKSEHVCWHGVIWGRSVRGGQGDGNGGSMQQSVSWESSAQGRLCAADGCQLFLPISRALPCLCAWFHSQDGHAASLLKYVRGCTAWSITHARGLVGTHDRCGGGVCSGVEAVAIAAARLTVDATVHRAGLRGGRPAGRRARVELVDAGLLADLLVGGRVFAVLFAHQAPGKGRRAASGGILGYHRSGDDSPRWQSRHKRAGTAVEIEGRGEEGGGGGYGGSQSVASSGGGECGADHWRHISAEASSPSGTEAMHSYVLEIQ